MGSTGFIRFRLINYVFEQRMKTFNGFQCFDHSLRDSLMMDFSVIRRSGSAYLCLFCLIWILAGCGPSTPVEEISVSSSNAGEELPTPQYQPDDWPGWRGQLQNGHAVNSSSPVWTDLENVRWKVEVPGRGHATPTIVGKRLYLETADEEKQVQSVLAIDLESGDQIWETEVHQGNFPSSGELHGKSTQATSTIACDNERLFAVFFNNKQIWLTALDLQGNQLWQKSVGPFVSRFGYAPSPVIYNSFVIVASEHSGGGYLAAVHRKTGTIAWRIKRSRNDSYSTPAIIDIQGTPQLLISGNDEVTAYNPDTGEKLWSAPGTSRSTCGTIVVWNDYILASGGYPGKQTVCVKYGSTPEVNWTSKECFYVPSMITHNEFVYGVNDKGIAFCWDIASGEQQWRARMVGAYSASASIVGDTMFVISEQGKCSILRANPERLEKISEKQLGDEAFASPVISGDNLFLRVADRSSGSRQEWLYCIGANEPGSATTDSQ